jgi:hypothetical protein
MILKWFRIVFAAANGKCSETLRFPTGSKCSLQKHQSLYGLFLAFILVLFLMDWKIEIVGALHLL